MVVSRTLSKTGLKLAAATSSSMMFTSQYLSDRRKSPSLSPSSFSGSRRSSCEGRSVHGDGDGDGDHGDRPQILFLGTGSSTGCPVPRCALMSEEAYERRENPAQCHVSRLAARGDPRRNRDYRNNPSILVSHRSSPGDPLRHVIVDVGKTFREGALRWMPRHHDDDDDDDAPSAETTRVDAVVLTHEHMDAVGGLDDVRGFQTWRSTEDGGREPVPVPVHLSRVCLDALRVTYPYLVPTPPTRAEKEDDSGAVKRHVAALDFRIVEPFRPFCAAGLSMIPLPVKHGEDMVCLGFAFSLGDGTGRRTNVVYLSDVSRVLPETEAYILNDLPPTDVLVVDSLRWRKRHSTHFCLEQAVDLARKIRPKRSTYLLGMSCDDFLPHDDMNKDLERRYPDLRIRLAHDGLVLPC